MFRVLLVRRQRLDVDALANDVLDLIAASGFFNVSCKGPLADAPIVDRTRRRSGIVVAGHVLGTAPVRLTGDFAKIAALGRIQIDADVVRPSIASMGHAIAVACVARQGCAVG